MLVVHVVFPPGGCHRAGCSKADLPFLYIASTFSPGLLQTSLFHVWITVGDL